MKLLTPLERVISIKQGRKPDKIPISTGPTNEFLCHYYRISIEDYLGNASMCAESSIKFAEEFQVDSSVVAPGYIFYGCGPELGVRWQFVNGHLPGFLDGPLKSELDLDKIKIPEEASGYFKHYLEVLTGVHKSVGETYNLVGHILGPFAVACFLRGIETTLLDTIQNPEFFKKYLTRCTDLSEYFGRHVIATGIGNPILNEIFLTPQMIGPEAFHRLIAPFDRDVQERLGAEKTPNVMGAFMGKPGNPESQRGGALLYRAFFGVGESLDTIKEAMNYALPGLPFPVTISGQALDQWPIAQILGFFKEALDCLVKDHGFFPTIHLASVLAHSREDSAVVGEKLQRIREFRDGYSV
jgi:hypothetical protein